MPIPPFTAGGFLPIGIFGCTLAELRARFGSFQQSDQRPRLYVRLEELLQEMRASGLFDSLLVDGSFVTAKTVPNDIHIVAVLRPGCDFERDLPVSEFALVSRSMLRRRFGFTAPASKSNSL